MLLDRIKSESIAARKAAVGKPDTSPETLKSKATVLLLSEIQKLSKEAGDRPLTDLDVVGVVKKSLKSVEDAVAKGVPAERVEVERGVLASYLPEQLSEEKIRAELTEIAAGGDLTLKDMGRVKAILNEKYPGQVDAATVSKLLRG
jgi:hypothetical protein